MPPLFDCDENNNVLSLMRQALCLAFILSTTYKIKVMIENIIFNNTIILNIRWSFINVLILIDKFKLKIKYADSIAIFCP